MLQKEIMQRLSAEFLSSAAQYADIPKSVPREFCVLGRSNVGKSSFINHVFGNSGLARVSKTPGKTTLANFYKVSDGSIWADMPGYGYAERAKTEQVRWSRLIADYCENRENLKGVILLCDLRHPGLAIDKEAFSWLASLSLPVLGVLTKADKLPRREQHENMQRYRQEFGFAGDPIPYSIVGDSARELFCRRYFSWAASLAQAGQRA
jgi:GTP-binding protein